jgi:hypothetical protein
MSSAGVVSDVDVVELLLLRSFGILFRLLVHPTEIPYITLNGWAEQ